MSKKNTQQKIQVRINLPPELNADADDVARKSGTGKPVVLTLAVRYGMKEAQSALSGSPKMEEAA